MTDDLAERLRELSLLELPPAPVWLEAVQAMREAAARLRASPPAGEVGKLVERLQSVARRLVHQSGGLYEIEDVLEWEASAALVRQAEEIERYRKVVEAVYEFLLREHMEDNPETGEAFSYEARPLVALIAEVVTPFRPATADKPEEKHDGE